MKNYELIALITPLAEKREAEDLLEKATGFKASAVKIKLAYPIKKIKEAFLASISFSADIDKLREIKEKINSEKNILRHMIVAKRKESLKPARKKDETKKLNKEESRKVDIEKIDQKIEEILS